jgi:hypothetical protein
LAFPTALALLPVELIQEPSWGVVLSDFWAGAIADASVLRVTLEGIVGFNCVVGEAGWSPSVL